MATQTDILPKITRIIAENLGVEAAKIKPDARFIEDLGADSLDVVEMMLAFEDEFGIEINEEDAEDVQVVQDVIDYIIQKAK